jgi:hypothetical protein
MFADELRRAIASASRLSLDALATLMWDACANARISEAETEELATLIDVRRNPEGRRSPEAQTLPIPVRVPGTGSRPKTPESLTRRRRVAACGRLPPSLACHFTQGEVAVLSVVASDAMQDGACRACLADIGDRAGVSRSTVKNALRQAKALKLITVEERRLTYWRNLTNIVEIVSPEWQAWNRLAPRARTPKDRSPEDSAAGGGGKFSTGSNTLYKKHLATPQNSCRKGSGWPEQGGPFETFTPCTRLTSPKPTGTGG